MENPLSFPRQLRGPDTRSKETLRILESSCSTEQHSLKFICSFWGAIRQSVLRLGPFKFQGVESKGISWKPLHMEAWVAIEEVIDRFPLMGKNFVP